MSQTAVLVWLSATSLLPTFRADLTTFAQARLFRLEAPRDNAASSLERATDRASAYAPDAALQVENSLEEARNAAGALEQSRALAALDHAERVLRDHAELPQSAWLMAEILELSADVERTVPGGAEAAQALRQRATALEGPRATPFTDSALDSAGETEHVAVAAPALAVLQLRVQGLEADDRLEWDGLQRPVNFETTPGEHHARVERNGRLLWAGWTHVVADAGHSNAGQLRLPVPETVACSLDDIGQGRFEGGRALAPPHARCDSYLLARAGSGGGIEAALCERNSCGKVIIWRREAAVAPPLTTSDQRRVWPYAVAVTAGVLAATAVVLWRAGVFDRPQATTHESWVYNGQQQAMGFAF